MICTTCGSDKSDDEFYKRSNRRGRYAVCKPCFNSACLQRQRENKARAVAYLGGKCVRCDYSRCLSALEFHHTDPTVKEQINGKLISRSWSRIIVELEKCILLCANCHREAHGEVLPVGVEPT